MATAQQRPPLRELIEYYGYNRKEVAEQMQISRQTLWDWTMGKRPIPYYQRVNLAEFFQCEVADLAPGVHGETLVQSLRDKREQELEVDRSRRNLLQTAVIGGGIALAGGMAFSSSSPLAEGPLTLAAGGIATCQNLYHAGQRIAVEQLLPAYRYLTVPLAEQSSPIQKQAAGLASQVQQLVYELEAERENFGTAKKAIDQALEFAELSTDPNLQVASLVSMANLAFHRKDPGDALLAYKRAESLFRKGGVTTLSQGRVYAGEAECFAMMRREQEALRARGMAHEIFPANPGHDTAYQVLRADRYALWVFGGVQSYLFLGKYDEAAHDLAMMQRETSSPETEPATKLDLLLYQAEIVVGQKNLPVAIQTLREGATLAKQLGSRLYFNKLLGNYIQAYTQWKDEPEIQTLAEAFHW